MKRNAIVTLMLAIILSLFQQFPALANYTIAVTVNGVAVAGATSSTSPANITVPSDNSVDAADAVKVSLSSLAVGSSVSIIANNASVVTALSTVTNPVKATDGAGTMTINTGTGTTAEFFVFTKSITLASFTVSSSGVSYTYYLKGSAGPAYNLSVNLETTGYVSSFAKIPMKVTDVFGNPVAGITPTISAIGMLTTSAAATDATGSTEITVTYPSTAGKSAIQISIAATSIVGLPASNSSFSAFIEVVSLVNQLALEKAKLVKEIADRAQDKLTFEKALAEAQAAKVDAETELAQIKTKNDAKIAELDKLTKDLNSQLNSLKTTLQSTQGSLLSLNSKYLALVKKYNTLAKKFKQPTIKA